MCIRSINHIFKKKKCKMRLMFNCIYDKWIIIAIALNWSHNLCWCVRHKLACTKRENMSWDCWVVVWFLSSFFVVVVVLSLIFAAVNALDGFHRGVIHAKQYVHHLYIFVKLCVKWFEIIRICIPFSTHTGWQPISIDVNSVEKVTLVSRLHMHVQPAVCQL